jgi:hypothetical protein
MDTKPDENKAEENKEPKTVAGYSGSTHEGKKPASKPKSASGEATISPLGATEPTQVTTEKKN